MIRRMVPARWPEALTGQWLPAESGFKGMREGGVIINIVCRQAFQLQGSAVHKQFRDCTKETEVVMKITDYLIHLDLGVPVEETWSCNPYYISKVALEHATRIVAKSLQDQQGKRYEPGIRCYAIDPGWLNTDLGGPAAPLSIEEGAEEVIWVAEECGLPTGSVIHQRSVVSIPRP